MTASTDRLPAVRESRELSGRYVVIAMFALGIVATTTMFIYWDLHTRPFRPLTEAIGREFQHSLPKVEGGSHKGSPMTLRIAMRVSFAPRADHADTRETINRVIELAREHADLDQFEEVHVHLFQLAPEQVAQQASFEYPIVAIRDQLPFSTETTPPKNADE